MPITVNEFIRQFAEEEVHHAIYLQFKGKKVWAALMGLHFEDHMKHHAQEPEYYALLHRRRQAKKRNAAPETTEFLDDLIKDVEKFKRERSNT